LVALSGWPALGPCGDVRLGRDDERPKFSRLSRLAMLFAGGMGAGLLFWGVAEQSSHFESPPGMIGGGGAADHAGRRAHGTVRGLVPHLPDLVARLGAVRRSLHRPDPPGRTIREFRRGVILAPTLLSILRSSAFGGTAY